MNRCVLERNPSETVTNAYSDLCLQDELAILTNDVRAMRGRFKRYADDTRAIRERFASDGRARCRTALSPRDRFRSGLRAYGFNSGGEPTPVQTFLILRTVHT